MSTSPLPVGFNVTHPLIVTVTANASHYVFESNETNNSASVTTNGPLSLYPDLQVQNLAVAPTSPLSGQQITINWDDADAVPCG